MNYGSKKDSLMQLNMIPLIGKLLRYGSVDTEVKVEDSVMENNCSQIFKMYGR